ncbi:type I pantothenate kinase [Ruania albidiflava]|uniref:type I pantothenate kinase n=1 Tax=Ruania albidiflava TaxID=366586 RepID=UPI003C6E8B97
MLPSDAASTAADRASDPARPPELGSAPSPFIEFDRQAWSRLSASTPLPLTADDVENLRGLGDPIDLAEVDTAYRPLSRLLTLYVAASQRLRATTATFLSERAHRTPFVIGVAGSVAVGKSTASRVLREMLRRWPETPRVELVTTDGFLLPNAELERRGLMERKGFPESYDRRALLDFLAQVKSGAQLATAPVYSHLTYDIVPNRRIEVHSPEVLIVEGLNVLAPARVSAMGEPSLAVSDFFDFSIYIDAATEHIRQWYIDRFLDLRQTAFADERSYFHRYASLDDEQARDRASQIWATINEPNLVENVLPTRGRATLVLRKEADHRLSRFLLRKI